MLEIIDYSSRRGAIVPFLTKMHAVIKENSLRDKLAGMKPPEHVITWSQKMRKVLLDINRRFYIALDGQMLAGVFFYRVDGGKAFIEDVQVAWAYRNNAHVIDGFLRKLEYDVSLKDSTFYASERVKADADAEMLASKGFKKKYVDGWEELGTLSQASQAIKIRYSRGMGA
ncbi:MAG: hypothetical protein FWF79_08645 [Defluviitaleaceae bacterium]|nr:hypothetical protein [Defluviitaleaceae bacterium]